MFPRGGHVESFLITFLFSAKLGSSPGLSTANDAICPFPGQVSHMPNLEAERGGGGEQGGKTRHRLQMPSIPVLSAVHVTGQGDLSLPPEPLSHCTVIQDYFIQRRQHGRTNKINQNYSKPTPKDNPHSHFGVLPAR